jgi:hypothetical protein
MENRWSETIAPSLRKWHAGHGATLMRAAIVIMAIAALVWLGYQFWRLLWGSAPIWPTSPTGAVDLKLLHRLVHEWFAGRPVYRELASAVHPPATYLLLWPLMGWLDVTPARWLWAITTVVALAALIHVKDLLACGLILATLVKPSISVPFLWLVLFVPGSPGPFSLVALGYGALTVIAVSFQDSTPWVLLHEPRGE